MPSFTIRPNGQGTYNGFTLAAGASKPTAMADASDATYVTDPATGALESYTLDNLPATAGAIVGSLVWHCRGNKGLGGAGAVWAIMRVGSAESTAAYGPGLPVGSISEQTATFANPPSGGSWTPAQVNALEAGFYNGLSVVNNMVDLWVTGTYTATTGGLGLILTMSLAPLLANPAYVAQVEKLLRAIRMGGF